MSQEHTYENALSETPKNKSVGKRKHMKLSGELKTVSLADIDDHDEQARSFMDEGSFNSLKQSISEEGLLHPLIVFLKDTKIFGKNIYQVTSGHRRLRAMRELGFKSVDVLVHKNEIAAKIAAVSANQHVESIHPIDKGIELESIKKLGIFDSVEDLASYVGISESLAYRYLSYSRIPESTRKKIVRDNLRNVPFLNKVASVCKKVLKIQKRELLSDEEVSFIIEEQVEELFLKYNSKNSQNLDSVECLGESKFKNTRILFIENGVPKLSEKKISNLNQIQIDLLREKALRILDLTN